MNKPTIVIAGDHGQFLRYKAQHPDTKLIEANRVEKLFGVEAREVVSIGTAAERRDYGEVYHVALSRVR